MTEDEANAMRLENLDLKLQLLQIQYQVLKKEREALDATMKAKKGKEQ